VARAPARLGRRLPDRASIAGRFSMTTKDVNFEETPFSVAAR